MTSDPISIADAIDLGRRYLQAGRAEDAETLFRQILASAPDAADAHAGLGHSLWMQDKYAPARDAFQAVLAISPDDPGTHTNLGNACKALGQLSDAERHHREALRLDPEFTVAHNNLGAALAAAGRFDEAIACFEKAIEQNPEFAQAHRNLAESLVDLGRMDEAAASAQRAIELNPADAQAYRDLAFCQTSLGQLDAAIQSHRTATSLAPDDAYGQSGLLYTLNFHPRYDAARIFEEHRAWGRRHANPLTATRAPHANDRSPHRRLRVGYVSPHFWAHAVNFFIEPILASHDRQAVEVYCYSSGSKPDETNARLRKHADQWREIGASSDEEANQLIRRDQIDILVDLAGHIPGGRMLLFAHKPAPVQVSYIGYQNTTGMEAIDYRLTDEWSDPPGTTEAYHTEKLVRLPGSCFVYQPSRDAPPVGPPPALANGYVTFGSFNYFAKITPDVLAAWARLLAAVPRSRLVILPHTARSLEPYLAGMFAKLHVDRDRWTLVDRLPRDKYLEQIGQVDVALDPFPFQGHTTTCDALWQGVPVVAQAGRTYASRFGAGAHVALGLKELVADSTEAYVEIARVLAGDLEKLQSMRTQLREQMADSPLMDFASFARNLEAAYRRMWLDWCQAPPGTTPGRG